MPSVPPGTFTRTVVSATYPDLGVNVAVSPDTCQLPATDGESVGSGVCGDSADENFTVIGSPPLASRSPPAGVTETTLSGATGGAVFFVTGLVTCLLSLTLASVSWPEDLEAVAANAQPATSTAVPASAVPAITRCRSSTAPARPAPLELPKNDTARFSSVDRPDRWPRCTRACFGSHVASKRVATRGEGGRSESRGNTCQVRKHHITGLIRTPVKSLRTSIKTFITSQRLRPGP